MIAIDSGIQNRPPDFAAIDLEQSFRRIRLHRRNRLRERRQRVAIERDLKDQRLSLLRRDLVKAFSRLLFPRLVLQHLIFGGEGPCRHVADLLLPLLYYVPYERLRAFVLLWP